MNDRTIRRVIIGNLLILLLAVIGTTYAFTRSQLQPPPFDYSNVVYPPDHGVLCAGADLRWTPTLTVSRVPSFVTRHRYIRQRVDDKRVWRDSTTEDTGWLRPATVTVPQSLTLPATLAPGAYYLDIVFTADGSAPFGYSVPFSIVACARPVAPAPAALLGGFLAALHRRAALVIPDLRRGGTPREAR